MSRLYPTCLIFSHRKDIHTTAVISKLSSSTFPFICDFSLFGNAMTGSVGTDAFSEPLLTLSSGIEIAYDKLETIWWRRPQPYFAHPPEEPGLARYVSDENYRFWESALALLAGREGIRWYNPVDANRAADRKLYQLAVARELGLRVPETLATSSEKAAREFCSRFPLTIFKSFAGNDAFWQPTRLFRSEMREQLNTLHLCPVIFQEFIEGRWDLRVTVIDAFVQAVRFNVGDSRYPYDVRIDTRIKPEPTKIDPKMEKLVLKLVQRLGLRYGSIDLRETLAGDLVFFEINPAGQFLYLDLLAGSKICEQMASALSVRSSEHCENQHYEYFVGDEERSGNQFDFNESDRPFAERVTERVEHLQ